MDLTFSGMINTLTLLTSSYAACRMAKTPNFKGRRDFEGFLNDVLSTCAILLNVNFGLWQTFKNVRDF
jgi:hypothetical protein